MRDMREVGIKMNTLEGRLDELYQISDAFSGDEVYVLENKVRLLQWMLAKGENVK